MMRQIYADHPKLMEDFKAVLDKHGVNVQKVIKTAADIDITAVKPILILAGVDETDSVAQELVSGGIEDVEDMKLLDGNDYKELQSFTYDKDKWEAVLAIVAMIDMIRRYGYTEVGMRPEGFDSPGTYRWLGDKVGLEQQLLLGAPEPEQPRCTIRNQAHFDEVVKNTKEYQDFISAKWGKAAKQKGKKVFLMWHPDKGKIQKKFPGCPKSYADKFMQEFTQEWTKRSRRRNV